MKFRTEVAIRPSVNKIDQHCRLLSVGSCFAEEMTARLLQKGITTLSNPLGTLYNPLSIERCIERLAEGCKIGVQDVECVGDRHFCYDTHGSFDSTLAEAVVEGVNRAIEEGCHHLQRADWVVLTLGTAWVYEREGRVVANCHKVPAREFLRRRLSLEEIVESLRRTVRMLGDRHIILTVSPIRHLGDGLVGNALSKSLLRVAASIVEEEWPNVSYFPAYEILLDELRDYRFYADDMVHPSRVAVEYVWEQFAVAYLSEEAKAVGVRFEKLAERLAHRPLHPESSAYALFRQAAREDVLTLLELYPENDVARRMAALCDENEVRVAKMEEESEKNRGER